MLFFKILGGALVVVCVLFVLFFFAACKLNEKEVDTSELYKDKPAEAVQKKVIDAGL